MELAVSDQTVRPDPDDPTRVVIDVELGGVQLLLDDHRTAIPTLRLLIREVAQVLMALQADFGERDDLHINQGD
jgi:hypothetical protein